MSGRSLLRMFQALCAALALVVLPRFSTAAPLSVSEGRAPSIGAQRRPQELPTSLFAYRRQLHLPSRNAGASTDKEGAGRSAAARSAASTGRGRQQSRVSHTKVNGLTITPITSFDVFGRPIQQDLPLNSLTSGQTIGETAGRFWEFSWGSDDRPSQVRPVGTSISWPIDRDPTGRVSRVHDERNSGFGPTGRESLFTWRPDGQPQTTTQHGVTTTFGYDPTTANLTSTTDTLGRALALTYSPAGNVQTVNDGTTTITFGHDADNRLTTITDALGHVTTMGYAHAGCACAYGDRVTSLHTPDLAANQKWSFTYDPDGQRASVTDPLGKAEGYVYNASRDLIGFTDRKNRSTTFTYDQLGRPASTQDPALRKGTFAYPVPASGNWTGAAVFAGSPDNQAAPTSPTASLRDGEYQIGLREHRAGGNPAQIEFYRDATFELSFGRSFDSFGRLRRREDRVGLPFASGGVFGSPSFFDHDLNYELNTPLPILSSYATSRPGGFSDSTFTNSFEFDTTASQGLFGPQPYTQESYTRDAAGRITGITTTFRVSSNIYAFPTLGVTYHSANKRQVQQLSSGAGVQDFTYDSRGLVATRTVQLTRWVPNPNPAPPPAPPPDPPYQAEPGPLGTFSYQWDEVGRDTLLTFPDGHRRLQIFDELGRLVSRCYEYPNLAPTRCYTAQYDDVGSPTLLTDPERSCTIGYDDLDRVASVSCSDGHSESYAYNALGALSVNGGVAVDHQRPRVSGGGAASAGLPATHAGQPVSIDAVGRVTSLNGSTIGWNRLGRLISNGSISYGFDPYLRRAVRIGGQLELYQYEGPNVLLQAHDTGWYNGVDRTFGYDGIDHPLWMYDRVLDGVVWFELDTIGNVRRLRGGTRYNPGATPVPPPDPPYPLPPPLPTDLGGYKYTAFGKALPADAGTPAPTAMGSPLEQPLRWQGRLLDASTGLYDFRNRVWSPELAAFLSPDEFKYFHRQGTLWSWPGQNPFRNRDPWGLVVPTPSPQPGSEYVGFSGWFTFMDVGMFMFSSAFDAAKAGNYGDAALDAASGTAALLLAETNVAIEAWTMAGMPGLGAALGPKACPSKSAVMGGAKLPHRGGLARYVPPNGTRPNRCRGGPRAATWMRTGMSGLEVHRALRGKHSSGTCNDPMGPTSTCPSMATLLMEST